MRQNRCEPVISRTRGQDPGQEFLMSLPFQTATVSCRLVRSYEPAGLLIHWLPTIMAILIFSHITLSETAFAQADKPKDPLETELVTVRPHGFEPAEITRIGGRFLLAVENRSGVEELWLRLDNETGGKEREERVHRKKLDWNDVVELKPGSYRLTEAHHPDWVCRITIGNPDKEK
jgi:hypothetical protein